VADVENIRDATDRLGIRSRPDMLQMARPLCDKKRPVRQERDRPRHIERPGNPLGDRIRAFCQHQPGLVFRAGGPGLRRGTTNTLLGPEGRRQDEDHQEGNYSCAKSFIPHAVPRFGGFVGWRWRGTARRASRTRCCIDLAGVLPISLMFGSSSELYQQTGENHCDAYVIAVSPKPSLVSQNRDNPGAIIGPGRVGGAAEKSL